MATSKGKILNPRARQALNQMKYEIANSIGVDYNTSGGYLGDITARQAGKIGGEMVRNMIAAAEQSLISQTVAGAQASFSQSLRTSGTGNNLNTSSGTSNTGNNFFGSSN